MKLPTPARIAATLLVANGCATSVAAQPASAPGVQAAARARTELARSRDIATTFTPQLRQGRSGAVQLELQHHPGIAALAPTHLRWRIGDLAWSPWQAYAPSAVVPVMSLGSQLGPCEDRPNALRNLVQMELGRGTAGGAMSSGESAAIRPVMPALVGHACLFVGG